MRFLITLVLSAIVVLAPAVTQAREILAYNTYENPPYGRKDRPGLANLLIDRLNNLLAPDFHFTLVNIPKARLQATALADPALFHDVVLFTNPSFIGEHADIQFSWSVPLFTDCDVIVFGPAHTSRFLGESSLGGLRFSGVRAYRYWFEGLSPLPRLQLEREDTADELSGLRKVVAGHADFTVLSFSVYESLMNDPELSIKAKVKVEPYRCFARYLMAGAADTPLLIALNRAAMAISSDIVWQRELRRAGIGPDGPDGAPFEGSRDSRSGGQH